MCAEVLFDILLGDWKGKQESATMESLELITGHPRDLEQEQEQKRDQGGWKQLFSGTKETGAEVSILLRGRLPK